jgi:hypothetical protein
MTTFQELVTEIKTISKSEIEATLKSYADIYADEDNEVFDSAYSYGVRFCNDFNSHSYDWTMADGICGELDPDSEEYEENARFNGVCTLTISQAYKHTEYSECGKYMVILGGDNTGEYENDMDEKVITIETVVAVYEIVK